MRKNLRKIRKSKGYSQEALSVEANVSITNIYNIENYKKLVKKETLDSVLKHLDVEMSYDEYEDAVNDKSIKHLGEYEELYKNQTSKLKTKVDKKLREAENLLKNEKYEKSLKIYLSFFDTLGHDNSYILTCVFLYQKVGKHHKSINYCNKILNNDENNSQAQKIKESSLASLKELNLLTKDKMKNYTIKDFIEYYRTSEKTLYNPKT
ncbi:helix-turn-helix domain-containing protein [Terrisporobacter vanillatitrophus]|uniref:helix-turn-helix domain-containing protein n=1 Tax=Terrisporobacter vanillatitrophus TaxID=3058402 RepID=UPI003EBAE652